MKLSVTVRQGAPKPDISSFDAVKKALLSAKSVGYVDPERGTIGVNAWATVQRLGIVGVDHLGVDSHRHHLAAAFHGHLDQAATGLRDQLRASPLGRREQFASDFYAMVEGAVASRGR